MADKTKFAFGSLLIVVSIMAIYVSMGDDVRMRVDSERSIFYANESNRWLISGIEEFKMVNRTKTVPRIRSGIKRTDYFNNETNVTTINRITPYKGGCWVNATWTFDGKNTELKNFPVTHVIERINCTGLRLEVDWKRLKYDGETIKGVKSPQSFGRNMKVEWDGDYYYSKIYKYKWRDEGKLTVKWRTPTDYEVVNVRLFDPPAYSWTYQEDANETNYAGGSPIDGDWATCAQYGDYIDYSNYTIPSGIDIGKWKIKDDATVNMTLGNCFGGTKVQFKADFQEAGNMDWSCWNYSTSSWEVLRSGSTTYYCEDAMWWGDISSTNIELNLNTPANETITEDSTPDFDFTVIGDFATYSCELFIDSVGYGANASVLNNTATTITANNSLTPATYDWFINCTDNYNLTKSEVRQITINTSYPNIAFSSPTPDDYHSQLSNSFTVNISTDTSNYKNHTYRLYNSTSLINTTSYTSYPTAITWVVTDNDTFYYNVTIYDTNNNSNSTATRLIRINTDIIILSPENRTYDIIDIDLNWTSDFVPNWSVYNLNSGSNVSLNQDTLQETQNTPDANSCDGFVSNCGGASDGNTGTYAYLGNPYIGAYYVYQNFTGIESWVEYIKLYTYGRLFDCGYYFPNINVYYWNYGSSSWSLIHALSYDDGGQYYWKNTTIQNTTNTMSGGILQIRSTVWRQYCGQSSSYDNTRLYETKIEKYNETWDKNTTIHATAGNNNVILYANDSSGNMYSDQVYFFVNDTIDLYLNGQNNSRIYELGSIAELEINTTLSNETTTLYIEDKLIATVYPNATYNWTTETFNYTEPDFTADTNRSYSYNTYDDKQYGLFTISTNGSVTDIKVNEFTLYGNISGSTGTIDKTYIDDTTIAFTTPGIETTYFNVTEDSTDCDGNFTINETTAESTQTYFGNGQTTQNVTFNVDGGNETMYINIPRYATLTSANVTITGTNSSYYETVSLTKNAIVTKQHLGWKHVDAGGYYCTNAYYYQHSLGLALGYYYLQTSATCVYDYRTTNSYLQYSHTDYDSLKYAYLYLYTNYIDSTAFTVEIKEVADDSWDENSITWNTKPAVGSNVYSGSSSNFPVGYNTVDITTYAKGSTIQSISFYLAFTMVNPTRKIFFNSRTDADNPAYIRAYHYPSTFKIDTGNDGNYAYNISVLNVTDEIIELNYTAMQDYIDNQCTTDMCSVPLLMLSSTDGQAQFKNLEVKYTMKPYNVRMDVGGETVFTSSGVLNYTSIMVYDIDTTDSRIPIEIHNDRTGTVTIESLDLTYTVGEMNTSNIDWFNITAGNWNGNKTTAEITMYYDGSANMTIRVNNSYYEAEHEAEIYYSNYTVTLPTYIDYIEFIPLYPTSKNVTPYGQYSTRGILNITTENRYNKNMSFYMLMTDTSSMPCINTTISSTSDKNNGQLMNGSWFEFIDNKNYSYSTYLWIWADYNCNYTSWRMWQPEYYFRGCAEGSICSEDTS